MVCTYKIPYMVSGIRTYLTGILVLVFVQQYNQEQAVVSALFCMLYVYVCTRAAV